MDAGTWGDAYRFQKVFFTFVKPNQKMQPLLGESAPHYSPYSPTCPVTVARGTKVEVVDAFRINIFSSERNHPPFELKPNNLTTNQFFPLLYHPFIEAQLYYSWYPMMRLMCQDRAFLLTPLGCVTYGKNQPTTVNTEQRNQII